MTTIERSIEIDAPASIAYDVWTQFERFPSFMKGVESVRQVDDRHLHWRAKVAGRVEEWRAEITEQIPDKRIAWASEGGIQNAGVVTFHRLSDERSRVMLQIGYELDGLAERVGDALGFLSTSVAGDLERFKDFVEREGERVGGWRGRVPAPPDAAQQAAGEAREDDA